VAQPCKIRLTLEGVAGVAKLADAPGLGPGPERGGGSSPLARTNAPLVPGCDVRTVPVWAYTLERGHLLERLSGLVAQASPLYWCHGLE
jgi:hypothetical protein